ncbi:DUF2065 domain-containing protein [Pseudohalocynthiibacter aestuariivivens]|uniref:DUF2065 domain-containing protein n=1 Tax=Pseudohalocynthiibacter aestuariivivens TaxID=1591409 RepID=A0ABV5JC41_9RHOB
MIKTIFLAIGLVLAAEGLVLALAPSRVEDMLAALRDMPVETRRLIGLIAVAAGTLAIWLAKSAFA